MSGDLGAGTSASGTLRAHIAATGPLANPSLWEWWPVEHEKWGALLRWWDSEACGRVPIQAGRESSTTDTWISGVST